MRLEHEPKFSKSAVYYIYSFGAEQPVDVNLIAERLLRSQLAETVGSPASVEVRVAPRYRALAKSLRQAGTIASLGRILEADGSGLGAWIRKHPIWAARIYGNVALGLFRRDSDSVEDRSKESVADVLDDVSEELTEAVANAQAAVAIQQFVESKLFRPGYLESEPYLRLDMRHSTQWWRYPTSGEERVPGDFSGGGILDAYLMVHRSGVMQLTLAAALPDNISASDMLKYGRTDVENLSASEFPEPLLTVAYGKDSAKARGEWKDETEAGVRWRRMEHGEPTTVSAVFDLYKLAIENAAKVALEPEYMCYSVLCIDELGCCSSESEWRSNHAEDLTGIVTRFEHYENAREGVMDTLMPPDMSLVRDTSTYLTEGGETIVSWHGAENQEMFEKRMWHTFVTESALLQYWQLGLLETRLAATFKTLENVRHVQEEAIFGLQEYRHGRLTYGTANDMVQHLLALWNADRRYSMIMESLGQLQDRVANDRALLVARRANLMAGTAVVLALMFGLPAIDQAFEVINSVPTDGFFEPLAKPLRSIARRGDQGVWMSYVAIVLGTLGVLVTTRAGRSLRLASGRSRRRRLPGYSWPFGTIELIEEEETEVAPKRLPQGPFSLG